MIEVYTIESDGHPAEQEETEIMTVSVRVPAATAEAIRAGLRYRLEPVPSEPARDAHDPGCPVRVAHPRVDLGDLPASWECPEHANLEVLAEAKRLASADAETRIADAIKAQTDARTDAQRRLPGLQLRLLFWRIFGVVAVLWATARWFGGGE
jgi:hypothetical protein